MACEVSRHLQGSVPQSRLPPLACTLRASRFGGGLWERHCDAHLKSIGFKAVPSWRNTCFHNPLSLALGGVDDFKMARSNVAKAWEITSATIHMERPELFVRPLAAGESPNFTLQSGRPAKAYNPNNVDETNPRCPKLAETSPYVAASTPIWSKPAVRWTSLVEISSKPANSGRKQPKCGRS